MMEQFNPYLPPRADLRDDAPSSKETLRPHRYHEGVLKGLGLMMLCIGALCLWVFIQIIYQKLKAGAPVLLLCDAYVWVVIFLGYIVSGAGLFGLRRWALLAVIILEALACGMILLSELSFSWAALFHGLIALSLLQSKACRVVTR